MALKGKQKKLDANKDGKISGEDFSLLRERKALGGFLSKFARKASEQAKEGVVLPKSDSVKQLKELGLSDVRIKEVLDEFEIMSEVGGDGTSIDEFIKNVRADMPKYVNLGRVRENLQKQGLSDETIDQFFEDVSGRMGTKEANMQASRLMLRIAGMEGEPPTAPIVGGRLVDREKKSLGGLASKLARRLLQTFGNDEKVKELTGEIAKQKEYIKEGYKNELEEINKAYADGELTTLEYKNLNAEASPEFQERVLEDLESQLEERLKSLNADIEVGKAERAAEREGKAKGGTVDDQMNALAISVSPAKIEEKEMNSEMLPDEEMEEEYVDYVVESTLDDEDKNYLNRALEKDAKLSEIFDQVVESATEFTGSGTVEGPGTGISDSIPARLSDGEFVFTAKATEEIGEDTLMSMMKEAEARADGRQDMANGGMVMEEEPIFRPQPQPTQQDIRVTKETVGAQASMREEEDLIGNELKKSMLSTAPYVRS
jgi:hypothetical protein